MNRNGRWWQPEHRRPAPLGRLKRQKLCRRVQSGQVLGGGPLFPVREDGKKHRFFLRYAQLGRQCSFLCRSGAEEIMDRHWPIGTGAGWVANRLLDRWEWEIWE